MDVGVERGRVEGLEGGELKGGIKGGELKGVISLGPGALCYVMG